MSLRYVSPTSPIVLLDYAELIDESLAAIEHVRTSVAAAFGSTGLGILAVRGIPNFVQHRADLLPLAEQLASLPANTLHLYEHPQSHYSFGWSHGKESVGGHPDLSKGSFYANPIHDKPFEDGDTMVKQFPSFCSANIWPTEHVPLFESAFKRLSTTMIDAGLLVARHCDDYVGSVVPTYPPQRLYDIIKHSRTPKARLLHYFPTTTTSTVADETCESGTNSDTADSWCGWHCDHGDLTALCAAMYIDVRTHSIVHDRPDASSGLYIRNRMGECVYAEIPADCCAFQIGESAMIHSGGVLQATPHCVRASKHTHLSRESFAVFMEGEVDETMSVPNNCAVEAVISGSAATNLPRSVPPLVNRWNPAMNFGEFTVATLNAYHPELNGAIKL